MLNVNNLPFTLHTAGKKVESEMFSLPLLAERQIQRPDTRHKASVLCRVPVSTLYVFLFMKKTETYYTVCNTHLSSGIRFTFLSNVPKEEILLVKS